MKGGGVVAAASHAVRGDELVHHGRVGEPTGPERAASAAAPPRRWAPHRAARVEVSPSSSAVTSLPEAAILRRMRRMILPERVFGSDGAQWTTSGAANAPISERHCMTRALRSSSDSCTPSLSVT